MAGAVVVDDVSTQKASAEELQALPVALTNNGGRPPSSPGGQDSSRLVPFIAVELGSALLGALIASTVRRHRRGPQAA